MSNSHVSQDRPMIELKQIRKSYGGLEVLKGVDLVVPRGHIVSIVGPSGSGKTTLLRTVNQLEAIDSGEIWVDGIQVNASLAGRAFEAHINRVRQGMGMVFQQFNLFPHLTVLDNITIAPIRLKGMAKDTADALARDLLAKVGLAAKADAWPARLSGGQKQRVAIARALAMQPKVMLLDEVTSALDPELVDEVNLVVKQLAREHMTMLLVTHEMRFAAEVSDWAVFMDGGVIVEEGPPEQVFRDPIQDRTRNFMRKHLAN